MSETTPHPNALARVNAGAPLAPIASVADLVRTFDELKANTNLLAPMVSVTEIQAFHQVSVRVLKFNPDPFGPDCYHSKVFHKQGEVSLSKTALLQILAASGGHVLPPTRNDDGSDPHYCSMTQQVVVKDYDGEWRTCPPGTKAMDLRAGSAAIDHLQPKQIKVARHRIVELCESMALERAVRGTWSIQGSYTNAEMGKPFVVTKLVRAWDLNDPEQKAAAMREAENSTFALFGPTTRSTEVVTPPELKPAPVEKPEPEPARKADPDDLGDEIALEAPEPETVEPIVCLCPCGDQTEVSEAVAKTGMERHGTVRCKPCYPGTTFVFGAGHPDELDLKLPNAPGVTVTMLRVALERAKK